MLGPFYPPFGGGGGATAEQIAQIGTNSDNIGLLSLRTAINDGWTIFNMVKGVADEYHDETGVDTVASSATYDGTNDYYTNPASYTLLIHSNTTDGSTTFVDSAGSKTVTANNQTQHSDMSVEGTGPKFGTTSILFDGTDDALSLATSADWDPLTNDWLFETWIYLNATTGVQGLFATDSSLLNRGIAMYWNGSDSKFHTSVGAGAANEDRAFTLPIEVPSLSADTWYHVRFVRKAGTGYLYVNGYESADTFTVKDGGANTAGFYIGNRPDGAWDFNGLMDEVAFNSNLGTYTTGDFTPPTAAYSGSSAFSLISEPATALAVPTYARIVALVDPIDVVTINTDLIYYATRDDFTSTSAATLTKMADYDANIEIYTSGEIDISGQTSGTTMGYQADNANDKELRIHGTWLQWG